ncbi:MAG TPA: hypothetical protein VEH10_04570 [Thermoplasmata archaeon]|nr:hypothetical protein [Thermoplasmata archaeon]
MTAGAAAVESGPVGSLASVIASQAAVTWNCPRATLRTIPAPAVGGQHLQRYRMVGQGRKLVDGPTSGAS